MGALVAEKTELEAKLAHMERAAEVRCQEVQTLTASRNEARAKLRETEDALQLANSASSHSEAAKEEAMRQVGDLTCSFCGLINSHMWLHDFPL